MTISKTANLVLVPVPGMGHLVPAMELAKQLVVRDSRISITVVLIKLPVEDEKLDSYIMSLKSNTFYANTRVGFIDMPLLDPVEFGLTPESPGFFYLYLEAYKPKVKGVVERLRDLSHDPVAGLLLDMFCTAMVDVATELGLPSYIFFPSNASLLRVMLHFQGDVGREYDVVKSPDRRLEIPGFRNLVPVSVLPGIMLKKDRSSADFLRLAEKYRLAKGIIVNTFTELEQDLIYSMSDDKRIPPIYPVGPVLNLASSSSSKDPTMRWLDDQPPRSVVFLCFGSRGSFNDVQVKEIATGLEQSGQRFLWSLRQRQADGQHKGLTTPAPLEFDDFNTVLPEGFLERTEGRGRVIGWAAQSSVLAHRAVGAFVSHCGWNSTLESFWHGVPIAAWPIYAEQQLNAFLLVKELGLATEIKIDYRQEFEMDMVVRAAEVKDGIRKAMDGTSRLRKKVNEMSEKARKAIAENGSSYETLDRFIDGVFLNLPEIG